MISSVFQSWVMITFSYIEGFLVIQVDDRRKFVCFLTGAKLVGKESLDSH